MLPSALRPPPPVYRGRLAPSPTGLLHLGHARTFWTAHQRALNANGTLILRNEDLDPQRSKPEFVTAYLEDLRWLGCEWQEGPDVGGAFGPYNQSGRMTHYAAAFEKLRQGGWLFPCTCSRKDLSSAPAAPHAADDEIIYPGTCRARPEGGDQRAENGGRKAEFRPLASVLRSPPSGLRASWRFRVPDGEVIEFVDGHFGPQRFVAGKDFGDFVVWRHDGVPSYQLAVVADDAAMCITEVVRGADLLLSTARQILLYRALGLAPPAFYHCPLMLDEQGQRLAKRHAALSLRALRSTGKSADELKACW